MNTAIPLSDRAARRAMTRVLRDLLPGPVPDAELPGALLTALLCRWHRTHDARYLALAEVWQRVLARTHPVEAKP